MYHLFFCCPFKQKRRFQKMGKSKKNNLKGNTIQPQMAKEVKNQK
jgi:hypothetical protein